MRRAWFVAAALLAAGCGSSAHHTATPAACAKPPAAGETHQTMQSGGSSRTYIRHVVASTKPLPLVVDLHGYLEGADIHAKYSELGPYGDTHGFDTITPQGSGNPVRWDFTPKSPDMKFIGDLLDEAERTMCVDTDRVYVTGLSNGAFMASAVACVYSDRVAAIAPVSGVRDPDGCHPKRRVPVLAIHGTADRFVSFDGGLGPAGLALPAPDGSGRTVGQMGTVLPKSISIPDIVAAVAKRNGCGATPTTTKVAADVERIAYPCPKGADVVLEKVIGGGHTWPGSPFGVAIEKVVGHTTMSISANDVIWRFFQAHPLHQ